MQVPFFRMCLDEREIDQVVRIMRKGYLTQGREVRALEKYFTKYIGCRYAIAVDSCTNALFLSLKYAGIGPGDIVTIPSLTFASVASVITHCGADIDFEDESYVGKAYYLKNNRPFKIVDSAHQIERAIYRDFENSMMCFSFYPTKQISSAEGGMIATNDHFAMEWLEKARWNGRHGGGFVYSIDFPGWKMNMTDVQAVIAMVQLDKLDDMNYRRKKIVEQYNKGLGKTVDSLHLYTIEVDERDKFLQFMDRKGINCSVHFHTPLHLQPAFKKYKKALPKTETIASRTVSLPLFADMTEAEADYVIGAVKEWELKI